MPDDLTQLTILLTGPQGTPYSQGLWRVSLKIPEAYPKSPPKAYFRTKIWHPNVEENTGSVCVDTLKKDWEPQLTLRDVLVVGVPMVPTLRVLCLFPTQTISCLLIQPNPDSALNSTAGHLLQEDYDSFARQARLMTSIHASIPPSYKEAAALARERGEDTELALGKNKSAGSPGMKMRKLPQRLSAVPDTVPHGRTFDEADSSGGEEDEASAAKENDPTLSPTPLVPQSPRRPTLPKRPLSDLPCPTEPEGDDEGPCLSPSEKNIANNKQTVSRSEESHQGPELAERMSFLNQSTKGSVEVSHDNRTVSAPEMHDCENGRSAKRICSDEAKENAKAGSKSSEGEKDRSHPASQSTIPSRVVTAGARKASAPCAVGGSKPAKPRVGLRRL